MGTHQKPSCIIEKISDQKFPMEATNEGVRWCKEETQACCGNCIPTKR